MLLTSCQNRNQVTHNKRKYRKGYYKPNRVKVKHEKTSKEEEYAYQSSVGNKEKKSQFIGKESHEEKSTDEENLNHIEYNGKGNDLDSKDPHPIQDNPKPINKEQTSRKKDSQKESDLQSEVKEEPTGSISKKTNWLYWVSLVLLILTLAAAALILLNILVFALIAVGLSAIGFTLSVINYLKYKNEPDTNFTKASSALMFAFFLVILLGGLLFIIITQTSF